MREMENYHYEEHETGIEHIKKDFGLQKVTILSLDILNHSEDRPYQDKSAARIERIYMFRPRGAELPGLCRLVPSNTRLENYGTDHEYAEENDLDNQSANDYVFS